MADGREISPVVGLFADALNAGYRRATGEDLPPDAFDAFKAGPAVMERLRKLEERRNELEKELRVLREKFAALAVGEYDGGESCGNAANIINVLDGKYDPREDFNAEDVDSVRYRINL